MTPEQKEHIREVMNDPNRKKSIAEKMKLERAKRRVAEDLKRAGVKSSQELGDRAADILLADVVAQSQPQALTAPGGLDHQKVLDKLRALYRAPLTDDEVRVRMLPITDEQITEALKAASLTRDQVRQQGIALGSSGRKLALQRRAEAGELKAEEYLRSDLVAGRVTGCKTCDAIHQMSDDELKAARAKLQAVLDYTKPIDAVLPVTVHVATESIQEVPANGRETTNDSTTEPTREQYGPHVTAGEAEKRLGTTSPGPEAIGEDHAHVPSGPVTGDHASIYRRN